MFVQFDPSNPDDRDQVRRILEAFDPEEPLTPEGLEEELSRPAVRIRPIVTAKPRDTDPDWDLWFFRFWQVVHAKIKRAVAEKAFQKAVERVAEDSDMSRAEAAAFITERMEAYAASPAGNPTDRSPTHPSTWLNGGQYEDDPRTWEQENGTPAPRRLDL